jgi:superfamily I DNA/RNA helicase
MSWLVPFDRLDETQRRVVEAGITEPLLVTGPAGSGKTALLLHRAALLRDHFGVPSERLRIFTFTNVLKAYLGSSLALLGLPGGCLSTFDWWCGEQYRALVGPRLPETFGHPDYAAIRRAVLDRLERHPGERGRLDAVLVDEGQDLPAEVYRILAFSARHITVALDERQRIFPGGARLEDIRPILGAGSASPCRQLPVGYRNSREVATFAAGFLDDPGLRDQFLEQARRAPRLGQLPLATHSADRRAELERLVELVRQRMALGDKVGLLFPTQRTLFSLARRLEEAGIPVQKAIPPRHPGSGLEADFASDVPKLATIHSAKGLSFDSVFLPRLSDESFPRDSGPARRRLLFVALTRAAKWAWIGRIEGEPFDEDAWLEEAAGRKDLVIQSEALDIPQAEEDEAPVEMF